MYEDRDSIEIFKRWRERERVREMARHLGEQSDDTDLFSSHARAEVRDGKISVTFAVALSAIVIAALFGVLVAAME